MWIIANTRAGSALKLETSMNAEDGYQNMETDAALVGRTGVVITPLRPSGTVDIDGRRLDVTADGAFIEVDATVQVTSVSGNYIVVERASAANE
jgi:membrane-bound serine protease (ClpP class)